MENRSVKTLCPYCKTLNENIHIESVKINRGGEITTVDYQGTKLKSGEPSGRGSKIEIVFWCESGHRWVKRIQFCKGETSVEHELITDRCERCYLESFKELWRD